MTPYEVLGVRPTSTDAEIRRAYLALARRFHPDANPGGEDRMRAVNEAWAVLGDRRRREAWDRAHAGPDAGTGFRPDDPAEDHFDPRAQPDVPYRRATPERVQRRGLLTVSPVGVFASAVVTGFAGVFFDNPALLGLGVVLFGLACLAMIVVLLVALVDARHDEG